MSESSTTGIDLSANNFLTGSGTSPSTTVELRLRRLRGRGLPTIAETLLEFFCPVLGLGVVSRGATTGPLPQRSQSVSFTSSLLVPCSLPPRYSSHKGPVA